MAVRKNRINSWEDRFKELEAFKKKHRHCNFLAARGIADHDLVNWVQDVRKSKKQGRLAPQRRIRRLAALGFCWSITRGK